MWMHRCKEPMPAQFAEWLEIISEFQNTLEHQAGQSREMKMETFIQNEVTVSTVTK